ncbi:glutathione S-transferase N-terminal domain-containing protein [Sphingomonas montana]|uniref:glutathione S-transferase N-terminal domain-containing protein n=1 Tax=Sphingomonas montana TaxID=1843236 RepID=UPI00097010BA|nr:glutathione S-transferase N-terminal domain-containing protein [Sphingomonas montana]
MKLYYAPATCAMADHIALIEAGIAYELVRVDLKAKTTEDGADYLAVNPKGYVPAIALDDGTVLTENLAILNWIADTSGTLMPADGIGRYRVIEATAYVSGELHKNFKPYFNPAASELERDEARAMLTKRFALVEEMLTRDAYLAGPDFTVADCYLFVTMNWAVNKVGMDLPPQTMAHFTRLGARASVQQAMREEGLA